MMCFTVPGKPEGKARPRMTRSGHAYTPEQTRAYEERIRLAYRTDCRGSVPFAAGVPVQVVILAYHAIPRSESRRRREKMLCAEILPTVKPDWDNVGKAVCDALNGLAWHDDAQVVEARVVKRYGIAPRIWVQIREATEEPLRGKEPADGI